MSKHFDVIVLGRSIGALSAAALLARRGFTVLVVGHGERPPTYEVEGRTLHRRSFTLLAATSPAFRRVLVELAQSQTWKRRVVPCSPMMQVLWPERRVDVPPDMLLFGRERKQNVKPVGFQGQKCLRIVTCLAGRHWLIYISYDISIYIIICMNIYIYLRCISRDIYVYIDKSMCLICRYMYVI